MISQREAVRLRKQVQAYERQESQRANAWCEEWPMGMHIASAQFNADSAIVGSIRTARKLKHAVVVSCDEHGRVNFHAMPLAKAVVA